MKSKNLPANPGGGTTRLGATPSAKKLTVSRYDLTGDVQYLATKEGFLFESKNNESRLVLDLNKEALFPFTDSCDTMEDYWALFHNNEFVYIAYTSEGRDFNSDWILFIG